MSYKKMWTEEKNEWLFKHGSEGHKELYRLFCEAFPEAETTMVGVVNQRSRIGACANKPKHPNVSSRKARPLYSEQVKKGYIRIKVAQPSVWMMKSKWVWLETHPWLYKEVNDDNSFIFLDGNNRNFNPNNIEKVTRGELRLLNLHNGIVKNDPDMTKFNLAKVRLSIAILDTGEKQGMTVNYGSGRILKSTLIQRSKEYRNRHKYKV